MQKEAIAIVGLSVFCPAGESVEEFWHNISGGGDFISDAPADVIEPFYFDAESKEVDRFYCKRGGFMRSLKVDPLRYGILPIAAEGIDPEQFIALMGAEQALQDAGVFEKGVSLQRGSVIIGRGNFSGLVAMRSLEIVRFANELIEILRSEFPELSEEALAKLRHAYQAKQGRYQADTAIGTMPNLIASLVANKFDLQGPAFTIDAACASGIVAVDYSIKLLRDNHCDIAVVGGMHMGQSAMFSSAFNFMGALSHKQQIAPFSKGADGLLIGQGCGFVVLKTLSKALEDGDRIYSLIRETAVCSDGERSHVMVTSVKGQTQVLDLAWNGAGMDPGHIGYVEAHGTGTPVGDKTELETLTTFFGDESKSPAFVGSIKSNIGHTMSAAGMLGLIKTALALYHRVIPPTLHCEEPLSAMEKSRFETPREAVTWDPERYPLVAGVNAFGFGGINSHAILTAYEPKGDSSVRREPKPYPGEALMVSASDRQSLLHKLEVGDYSDTGGDYRLVVFDPTEDRLDKARFIVESDKAWHGRMDIWFSSQGLLSEGARVAFMFPGINVDQAPEFESLTRSCDLPSFEDFLDYLGLQVDETTGADELRSLQVFFGEWLSREALKMMGFEADLYIGHSIGEWTASDLAGITDGTSIALAKAEGAFDDGREEYPMVAVSGMAPETMESWCNEIDDLYLSNDNCPGQMLLSGTSEATEKLVARLEEGRYFYTILPYSYGYHTPLIAEKAKSLSGFLDGVAVGVGSVPVWSATTLEPIPTERGAYRELVEGQLTRPVYFCGLIEKLYREQNVRVFVQIGMGSLSGFVEDTLKGRAFGAASCNSATRTTADQLRRVLALFFVEGYAVDSDFMGVKRMYQVEHSLMVLPKGAPLLTDLPELREAFATLMGSGTGGLSSASGSTTSAIRDPLLRAADQNLQEAVRVQEQLLEAFLQGRPANASAIVTSGGGNTSVGSVPHNEADGFAASDDFEEQLHLRFEDHPYLRDHAIVRQPERWEHGEDLNPVVPFTMTIELLAEIAMKHMPERQLRSIEKVMAYQWIAIEKPFEGLVKGRRKGPDIWELELIGYAKAEFRFGEGWPEPPTEYEGDIDLGEVIISDISSEEMYDRYSFHGPCYQSSVIADKVYEHGIRSAARLQTGKGSLLDIMGQQLGLFLHLTETKNTISFPVRLKKLSFYADIFDQDGDFDHSLIVTRLDDYAIVGTMVLKRDGRIWAIAHDFVCQRFENDIPIWNVLLKPQHNVLAHEIAPNVYHYASSARNNVLAMLEKRYLNYLDKKEYAELATPEARRGFLVSRIALKDAVRIRIARGRDEMLYPVEIFCRHDENGRPEVYGEGKAAELLEGLQVSLAHKDGEAIAMVSMDAVGVDLEKIEEKSEGFGTLVFTEGERALLGAEPKTEQLIRFWVAKEACSKKTGYGLQGNPKRFEVRALDGDVLVVGDEKVRTSSVGKGYIAGWTL